MKMSVKQREVVDLMKSGMTFFAAYRKAGLSEYGHNEAEFLWRLVNAGVLSLGIAETEGK